MDGIMNHRPSVKKTETKTRTSQIIAIPESSYSLVCFGKICRIRRCFSTVKLGEVRFRTNEITGKRDLSVD